MAALPPLNFFGPLSANLGLGVAARVWLQRLLDESVEVHAVDVPDYHGRSGHDLRFRAISHPLTEPAPHAVNLVALNPSAFGRRLAEGHAALTLDGRLTVIAPFWELPRLPSNWLEPLARVDLVLAATRFIAEAFRAAAPVEYVPLCIEPEPGWTRDRGRWGIPDAAPLFVGSFELASSAERKNPWGAIEAFRRAFPGDSRPRLVLKLNNSNGSPAFGGPVARLRALAAGDERIRILDETLPYREVLSLYAAADAYVSLHRAEGLGLALMESMALGTPVIATAWSGNLDFMSDDNSFLVGHGFLPVRMDTQPAYAEELVGADARWADPHLDEAAAWMRRIAEDRDLAARRGERAAADIAARRRRFRLDGLAAALSPVAAATHPPRRTPAARGFPAPGSA